MRPGVDVVAGGEFATVCKEFGRFKFFSFQARMDRHKTLRPFVAASAVEILLVLLEAAFSKVAWVHELLPIGGSPAAQIGICFGLAFAFTELARAFRPPGDGSD